MTRPTRPTRPETTQASQVTHSRKPRIIIAGEFSAGKTRLISGLIGDHVLPSNVTATALPPVWLVHGARGLAAVDLNGDMRQLDTLANVTVEDTHYCIVSHPSEFLKSVEIIDTPGSSDPNISSESWERMLNFADIALWCTNATQAWRQSEKSVWNEMPEHLVGPSTLLVTHADRMADERTANRVQRRVRREAKDYFGHFLMASLINSDDVRKVSDHVLNLASHVEELHGISNALTAQFALDQKPKETVADSAPILPKRVTATPKVAEAAASDVLVFNPSLKKDDFDGHQSEVRATWNAFLLEADQTDAASVLECVDRFLTHWEASYAQLGDDLIEDEATENKEQYVLKAIVNGRQK